jgi:signal transduction histidine kinase
MATDITGNKQVEEALRQAKLKLNLLSSITRHDINNQLSLQMGYLSILEDTLLDPSQKEYFREVLTAAERIAAIVQLSWEYEEIGTTTPVWNDVRTLVEIASKQVPLGKVLVQNDIFAGTEIFTDPIIAKVFNILIDNAVQHGGTISAIRFSSVMQNGDWTIICEDDGVGVPADEKEKILERKYGGKSSLGLFFASQILGIIVLPLGKLVSLVKEHVFYWWCRVTFIDHRPWQ